MAARRHTSYMTTSLILVASLWAVFNCYSRNPIGSGFLGAPMRSSSKKHSLLLRKAAFESGKVNVGVEIESDLPPPPQPVLECDESCVTAIYDCLEDGCSVDALVKLDAQLAEDEEKIAKSIEEVSAQQKTAYSEENAGTVAWLNNFLGRSGSLRAQLQSLKAVEDTDFITQIIKAAAVAFGGSRPNDYPKVGVSPYSESPP